MKLNRVVLNKEESRWFSRNVLKTKTLLEAVGRHDAEILKKTTYRTLSLLSDQAEEIQDILKGSDSESFEVELMVGRKHKAVVQQMISKTITALEDKILPVYSQRGEADYVEDTKKKISLLKTMVRKFR